MAKTILCHCEDVELEEVFSALEQGYGDIETLKRYTGIGTGKCQGKCCFVQTLRILAALKSRPDDETGPALTGNTGSIHVPTLRPPVLPMRIDDIVDGDGETP
ncbi:MAG: (2Fe-2S)-binding protein [Candidatus Krumholzibacteriia bacterium]